MLPLWQGVSGQTPYPIPRVPNGIFASPLHVELNYLSIPEKNNRFFKKNQISDLKHFKALHVRLFSTPPSLGGVGSTNKYQAFRARSVERGGAGGKPAE